MNVTFAGKVLWDAEPSADSYVVQSRLIVGTVIATVPTTFTEIPVQDLISGTSLTAGQSFKVEVASVDSLGNKGAFSPLATFNLIAPPPPVNIRVEG